MNGVVWAGSAWAVFLLVWAWRDSRAGRPKEWLNRENIAVLLALLGTKSIAAATSAEEVLRDPVVLERVVRGGLATLSLLIAGPILVDRFRHRAPGGGFRSLMILGAYLGIASITILYSAAPVVTAAKALEIGAGFTAVAAAALAADGGRRLRNMAKMVVALESALLVTAIVGFFALPQTFYLVGRRPGFLSEANMKSPFAHSNHLSAIGALVAIYALAQWLESGSRRERAFWLSGFIIGVVGLLLASGRQGVVILMVSLLVLLWFRRRAAFLTLIGPTVAVSLWLNWESLVSIFARGQPQMIGTLTGRFGWWEAALEAWAEHPWTGYGYGAGGRFVALANLGQSQVSNVHSGYVEALIGVGLIGVIPLLMAVGLVLTWATGALRDGRDVPLAILIVPLVVHTSVAQGFGAWLNADFVLLACLAGISDWWRKERAPPKLVERVALR